MTTTKNKPLVGIIMGSDSDWPTLEAAAEICKAFSVPHEVHVVSAHRTPDDMFRYAKSAHKKGLKVVIAGAGGAAHLPGMVASQTPLPVIGVPVKSDALSGMDSLLSIVQMPGGVPVATVAIGAGKNAGLLAVEILATSNTKLMDKLIDYKKELAAESRKKDKTLNKKLN
ncbi:MAG: 5-(carboxyamino)imidazole ribonucleotide mutase [Proteobacteria bacterium]|nr:5-(carboxyamino)imidazole ribonucleotide mutase [Pseudomonadota bacterium]NOG61475.1 5-(carboxyamino)imidazole ribonucleotide mutase [Pseudomonadota bacterium]